MTPQTAISLVILLLPIAQLVVPLQILVEFRQGLVRFREESFVLGANGSLNVCVHWCLLPLAEEQICGHARNTLDSKEVGEKKADGSSTRSVLTSFHVGRIIYTDIRRPATGLRPVPTTGLVPEPRRFQSSVEYARDT